MKKQILHLLTLCSSLFVAAQPCEKIIWSETFGAGLLSQGSPSTAVNPAYDFFNFGVGPGNYTICNAFYYHSSWHNVPEDHTPNDNGGYFMVIDGLNNQPTFYSISIDSLIPNTNYEFSGWAMNIDKPNFQSNLTFSFSICSTNGTELATTTTGIIPATDAPIWTNHGLYFNTGNNTTVILKIIFTATGYDDFAFDDFQLSQVEPSNISTFNQTLCAGEAITINGQSFNQVNPTETIVLLGATSQGCDSIIQIDLSFYPSSFGSITQELCIGQSITIGGTVFNANNPSGVVIFPGAGAHGCDSSLLVNILSIPLINKTFTQTLCLGEKVTIHNTVFDQSNPTGNIILFGNGGCDTNLTVSISFYPSFFGSITQELCIGQSITIGGTVFNANNSSGVVIFSGAGAHGCDSSVLVNILFIPMINKTFTQTLCLGEKITINNTVFDQSNPTGNIILFGNDGCDTNLTVNISFYPPIVTTSNYLLCSGQSITIGGVLLDIDNPSDTIVFSGAGEHGCDSIVQVSVQFQNAADTVINLWILEGQTFLIEGTLFDQSNPNGVIVLAGASSNGCDSILRVNLRYLNRKFFIPNAFSPNEDGTNDIFTVFGGSSVTLIKSLSIFDRWGELVFSNENFQPDNLASGWDGRFRNKPASLGVYVYRAVIQFVDDFEETSVGNISLIK